MTVTPGRIDGLFIIERPTFEDPRGFFRESFRLDELEDARGCEVRFVQENHSRSVRDTLRGLHWQYRRPQGKLVRVIAGEIFDVAVDIRRGSPTFGRWTAATLSAANLRLMFVPAGFAHGFQTLEDDTEVLYAMSAEYAPDAARGVRWDDPAFQVKWPLPVSVISDRDRRFPDWAAESA